MLRIQLCCCGLVVQVIIVVSGRRGGEARCGCGGGRWCGCGTTAGGIREPEVRPKAAALLQCLGKGLVLADIGVADGPVGGEQQGKVDPASVAKVSVEVVIFCSVVAEWIRSCLQTACH